jgi:MFS family permease
MIRDYLRLIAEYPRFLAFGCLHQFFSSPGQSYSLGVFGPAISVAFALSSTEFGLLYSTATLLSGCLLPFFGPLIDRVNLRGYSVAVGLLMVAALLATAFAPALIVLFLGVLGLRFSGQGLMTQIGGVSTNRFFGTQRGKALAVVGTGFALGTAVFPITMAFLIERFGWQQALIMVAGLVGAVFIPTSIGLIRKTDQFQHPPSSWAKQKGEDRESWTRRDVLQHPFFYLVMPLFLVPPFYGTGFMIHLGRLVEHKGWEMKWVASCFIASAVLGRVGSLCMGPIVDRFSARRLFSYMLLPYAIALTILATSTHPLAALLWLGLSGFSFGCMGVAMSSLWAETFGVYSLGAIASLVGASGVFASALSPVLFGWLLDAGFTIDDLVLSGVAISVLVSLLARLAPLPKAGSRNRDAGQSSRAATSKRSVP